MVGRALWDVFSDNHDVIAPDGREAVWLHGFYMGTIWINDRADLTPVYAMIFRRLATHGYDWEYAFPRIHAIDFGRDRDETADLADRLEQDRQRADLHTFLEKGHREALAIAKDRPPPATVDAYRQVYGEFPHGWPPWD